MFTTTPPWTFHSTFVRRNVYGTNRLWGNRPCGDSSSVGQNVCGRIAHAAKYLGWGETTMGQNVHTAKRPYMGRNVHGANCHCGETTIKPPYFHTWCGLNANLGCRSETCCTRLAEKYRMQKCHLCTITQLCWAISSQLRHILTIGKNLLNSNISSTCLHNMVNFGPLTAEICWRVWGTPANYGRPME